MYTILTDSCSDLNAGIAARFAQLEVGKPARCHLTMRRDVRRFMIDCVRARRAPRLRFRREILPRRLKCMRKRARLCWG